MLRTKMKSSSGATIILALLFFLLCAVVGSVILAAGTASGGRIAGLKASEQSYYTVTSAAKLLRDEIEGNVYSKYTITSPTSTPSTDYHQKPDGELAKLLLYHADQVYTNVNTDDPVSAPSTETFTVKGTGFDDVTAEFTMKTDYSISIKCYITEDGYTCTLNIPAAISLNQAVSTAVDADGNESNIKTTTLTWTDGTITNK